MFTYHFTSKSVQETKNWAKMIASKLRPGDILAMVGNLAAGKTTFTQGITEHFKVAEYTLSPTFTYINEYHGESQNLIHIDAYRLKSGEELIAMGLWEYFESGAIVIIEWADIVASAIPEDAMSLAFSHVPGDESQRRIILSSARELELNDDSGM